VSRLRRMVAWLLDWRTGATLLATAVVVLLAIVVVDALQTRENVLDQAAEEREDNADRIDRLNDRIAMLSKEVVQAREQRAADAARMEAVIAALVEQVRQLDGVPVAGSLAAPTPAPPPSSGDEPPPDSPAPPPDDPPPPEPPDDPPDPPDEPPPPEDPPPDEPALCVPLTNVCVG
jgi:cell division protein ZapA (FtsZ GTPase activity inhibitor)